MNLENVSTEKDRKRRFILILGIVLAVFTVACLSMAGVASADDSSAVGSDVVGMWALPDGTSVVFGEEQTGVMTDANGTKFFFSWKKTDDGKYQVTSEDDVQYILIPNKDGTMTNSAGTILTKEEIAVSDAAADIIDKIDAISETTSETVSETAYRTLDDSGAIVVTTEAALKSAVADGGDVKLGATITMNSELKIEKEITLDLNGCELRFKHKHHIYVAPGGDLTINDSSNPSTGKIMGGYSDGSGGCIFVGGGGKLTLNQGTIQDGATKNNGGGVYVDHGTFEMNGGIITQNETGLKSAFSEGGDGGGVYMNGGTFIMNGGEISDNWADGDGGGVYLNDGSTFTMTGGIISQNECNNYSGGGVYINNGTEFIMNDGKISENITRRHGAGVCVKGTFTMNDGEISDNCNQQDGSGVCVENGGTFTMKNGTISGNSSTHDNGIGVCVLDGGKFIMEDGTIEKNYDSGYGTSESYGGGVYVQGGEFEMSGGTIQENKIQSEGGGVFVCENGTMSVSGDAKITGNTKTDGKTATNVGLDSGGTLTLDGNLTGEIRISNSDSQNDGEFGTATSKASGAENILSEDGELCGNIDSGKLVWRTADILKIKDDYNFIWAKGDEGGCSFISGAITDITTTTTAKSPFPILGILAGLGAAAFFLRRR